MHDSGYLRTVRRPARPLGLIYSCQSLDVLLGSRCALVFTVHELHCFRRSNASDMSFNTPGKVCCTSHVSLACHGMAHTLPVQIKWMQRRTPV
jgi:hypothetical protein